jgi:hypothetical protein
MARNTEGSSLKQELANAIEQCRRQIQILKSRSGPGYGGGTLPQDNSREIGLLEIELRRLQEALEAISGKK